MGWYIWPAATKVVAPHPHQTKRKPTAVPSWNSQPPRKIFKQRKGRHGDWSSFGLYLESASDLFENANASDGTSCTAKASLTSCQAHAIFFNVLKFRVESHQLQARYANHLCPEVCWPSNEVWHFYVWLSRVWLNGFEACSFNAVNHLQWAYVQILLRDALRPPWPLNENVPVFDTLSRIGTGSCYLFDLASFGTNVKLKANLVLPPLWFRTITHSNFVFLCLPHIY